MSDRWAHQVAVRFDARDLALLDAQVEKARATTFWPRPTRSSVLLALVRAAAVPKTPAVDERQLELIAKKRAPHGARERPRSGPSPKTPAKGGRR